MKKENELIRLNKAIATSGIYSRRQADELIKSGKVKVNNKVVDNLSYKVLSSDKILVSGKVIEKKDFKYFLFYKPTGFITTRKDELGRKTIYDLLPSSFKYLKPVGRLDRDTEGLLILTNDGNYINHILHPRNEIRKTYLVKVKGFLTKYEVKFAMDKLLLGVYLEGKNCKVDQIKQIYSDVGTYRKHTILEAVIHEGINRQIRRMFQVLGYPVIGLVRTNIGNFNLNKLAKGKYLEIKKEEAYAIFNNKRKEYKNFK